ncbi:TPA: type 1 fimbrial protein [Proteus mirabilis]|nr:type 1 fimbrial protein [Proteus mirabilis]
MIIQKKTYFFFKFFSFLRIAVVFLSFSIFASDNNYYQNNNKGINSENSTGKLYIFGVLTESTCHIEMNSLYQSINMGNISLSKLKKIGDKGDPISFQITLLDCLEIPSLLRDGRNNLIQSAKQPGVKLRFISNTVPFYPQLIKVSGIDGLGLQISDRSGQVLPLHEDSTPYFLEPGQNQLTFFISPVKTTENIKAGNYNALISFELVYD